MSHYAGNSGIRTRVATKVWLHVYDLSQANDYLWHAGFGIHHSGIEVSGIEYTYGAGIYESNTPTIVPNAKHRERIELGSFDGGSDRLKQAIDELRDTFGPDDYNVLKRNCNHFCNDLSWKLLQRKIPGYVNRLSDVAMCLSCLIPKKFLEPVRESDLANQDKNGANFGIVKTSSIAAFSGAGRSLADATTSSPSERNGLLHRTFSSGGATTTSSQDIMERRELMRKAALARLELNKAQVQEDKQS
ncbi:hypothetical protein MPSEU_000952700 [Mayamaea pseudoterrestris]|nr:hypothetical protein MPSEU_000952700 [Mayamaea pseudoterrestris]